ncbi:hypothetical protein DICVIV_00452 [Dictyocaulus viviparus]|uniref:ET module n=1 Tax=Dictyocaulus viviparus TaxID=29172 RepID=A0A0D8YBD9_DICVI|nr:hypothetical protein DICVIV_00452 [Dictyocaulus viviparus]
MGLSDFHYVYTFCFHNFIEAVSKIMSFISLIALLGIIYYCASLECYTGFKYISGRSIGTSKITCSSPSDYCYNATADVSQLNKLSMAGCSTTRCFVRFHFEIQLSRNKCISQMFKGREIKFCCCNSGDLCNSKYSNLTFYQKVKERIKDLGKIIG